MLHHKKGEINVFTLILIPYFKVFEMAYLQLKKTTKNVNNDKIIIRLFENI